MGSVKVWEFKMNKGNDNVIMYSHPACDGTISFFNSHLLSFPTLHTFTTLRSVVNVGRVIVWEFKMDKENDNVTMYSHSPRAG